MKINQSNTPNKSKNQQNIILFQEIILVSYFEIRSHLSYQKSVEIDPK